MFDIPEEWLDEVNRKMGEDGVPHISRPFEALRLWTIKNQCSIRFDSPATKSVFLWFEAHSPTGAHAIGSLFTGVFYFDGHFWRVAIPVAYGTVQMNAVDSLIDIPGSIRKWLMESQKNLFEYCALWVDVMDYGYGMNDLRNGGGVSGFAAQLATSADRELRATVQLLTESARQPNPKAMETARMATEMFLKAYLAAHAGLTESDAQKRLSHDLAKAAERCQLVVNQGEFGAIARAVVLFPAMGDRYEGKTYSNETLWQAYCTAQLSGTTFVRSMTDRDSRPQMFGARSRE